MYIITGFIEDPDKKLHNSKLKIHLFYQLCHNKQTLKSDNRTPTQIKYLQFDNETYGYE